ncbi:MAG: nucleoside monophosphate kinase, partial [Nanoarchaeota archaeon]|nr:nucleoside monophosphate kinase [Nanoarchaeota archaeon]
MDRTVFAKLNAAYQRVMGDGLKDGFDTLHSHQFSFVPVIGKPGAGKGTALENLSKIYAMNIVTTGDIFRDPDKFGMSKKIVQDVKMLGKYFYVDNKQLVPDDLTMKVISSALLHTLRKDQFVDPYLCFADVFPRSVGQIELTEQIGPIREVWYFDATDEECIRRMKHRDTKMNRPDKGQYKERLDEYYARTAPALDALVNAGYLVRTIDTTPPPLLVADSLKPY